MVLQQRDEEGVEGKHGTGGWQSGNLAGVGWPNIHQTAARRKIAPGGGRQGKHSEYLGYILAEMQVLAREHPGASW